MKADFGELFAKMNRKDVPEAKFRIGETAIYAGSGSVFPDCVNQKYLITGVNCCMMEQLEEELVPIIEYSLLGFPFVVFEKELEKTKEEALREESARKRREAAEEKLRLEASFRYTAADGHEKKLSSNDPCTEWEISDCVTCITPCYFRNCSYEGPQLEPNTGKDLHNTFNPIYREGGSE